MVNANTIEPTGRVFRRVLVRDAFIAASLLMVTDITVVAGQLVEPAHSKAPIHASVDVLVHATLGAVVAMRNDLGQEPFGIRTGRSVEADFFLGTGTALSPGLPFLLTQSIATLAARGSGRTRRNGLIGLAIHGFGFVVGGLAEPITYDRLRRPTEHPLQTVVVVGNVLT